MTDEQRENIRNGFAVIREHLAEMEALCLAKGGSVHVDYHQPARDMTEPGDAEIRLIPGSQAELTISVDLGETRRDKGPLL